MTQVMAYLMDVFFGKFRRELLKLIEQGLPREYLVEELAAHRIERINLLIGRVVERMSNFGHVAELEPRVTQAKVYCGLRKSSRMLTAIETLLGGRGDDSAIHDQGGSGIMTLRNPVFAFVET